MPDLGERHAEEIERKLEREVETASLCHLPSSDYGSNLLEASQALQLGGARKVNGGIMVLPNYKSPTVNIRVRKWTDNVFWIKAEDFEAAQYIADAVFHLTGRHRFHFRDAEFRYPPLCLGTGELLTTREKCEAHVAKIAKGSALLGQRGDYRMRVKKLVLEAVKSPEAILFLKNLRAIPLQVPHLNASQEDNVALAATSEEEICSVEERTCYVKEQTCSVEEQTCSVATYDGGEENGTVMEVDSLSEEAIQSLAPMVAVDPACMFHARVTMDLDISAAFVPGFGMDLDETDSILHSEGLCIGMGCRRIGEMDKVDPIPNEYKNFLDALETQEEEAFKSIKCSDLEPFSPRPIMSYYPSQFF